MDVGRDLARVHVIEEPLSDYIRYELAAYTPNVDAGEDVRVISVARGSWPNGVPRHDFWLFDDERLWLMEYDPGGTFQATRLVDDPATVQTHRPVARHRPFAVDPALREYVTAHQPA